MSEIILLISYQLCFIVKNDTTKLGFIFFAAASINKFHEKSVYPRKSSLIDVGVPISFVLIRALNAEKKS